MAVKIRSSGTMTSVNVESASGGPVFPTLPGIIGNWRADMGVTGTSPITAVADQSGTNTLTPAAGGGAGGIVLNPTGYTGTLGAKSAFQFTAATGAALTRASFGITGPALSIFMIGQMSSLTQSYGALFDLGAAGQSDNNGANSAIILARSGLSTSSAVYLLNTANFDPALTIGTNVNIRYGIVIKDIGGGIFSVTAYVNGTPTLLSAGVVVSNTFSLPTLVIGSRWVGGTFDFTSCWGGSVCQIVACEGGLSSTDVGLLDTFFVNQWGS